jgi:hypothetical protein
MKILKICFLLFLAFSLVAVGANAQLENIAFHSTIVDSTFTNPQFAFDGIDGGVGEVAASGKLSEKEQVLTFELPIAVYLGQMKLTWLYNQQPFKLNIEISPDRQNWIKLTPDQYQIALSQKYSFSIQNINFTGIVAAKMVRITIPKGLDGVASNRNEFQLAEIEVFPNVDRFIQITKSEIKLVGDTEAFFEFNTNLETIGNLVYRKKGAGTWARIPIVHVKTEHHLALYNLDPATAYEVQFVVTDRIANETESPVLSFVTKQGNKALQKKVSGTFTEYPPDDTYVLTKGDPQIRINDNNTDYFVSMISSGEVPLSDQYVQIDLGSSQSFSKILMYWRALAYSEEYDLEVSSDGRTWKKIMKAVNAKDGFETWSVRGDPMIVQELSVVSTGRYIRMFVKKNSKIFSYYPTRKIIQLMEIKVF